MADIITPFVETDGNTMKNMNVKFAQANAEFAKKGQVNGYASLDANRKLVQMPTKADIGLDKVDNTPDADKTVKYAASAGNSNTSGTSTYAHYSSHAVGSGNGGAVRNITMSTAAPSGGVDGDVWHQYS